MALVYCTKCGHRVSTTAPRCPGCGVTRFQAAAGLPGASQSNRGAQSAGTGSESAANISRPAAAQGAKWKRPMLWFLGLAILVGALVAGDIYLNRFLLDRKVSQLLEAHQYGPALGFLQKKLQESPNNPHLHFLVGECYLAEGDLMRAQEFFESAIVLNPGEQKRVGYTYFEQGENTFHSGDTQKAEQMFALATKDNPDLAAKVAKEMLDRGEAAFQLRDANAAEQLFNVAVKYDPSTKSQIANDFANSATSDPDFADQESDERYAKLAAVYDPDAARSAGKKLFDKLSGGLCNLHALGLKRFNAMMKLCDDLSIPDEVKTSVGYRFAYALELYDTSSRPQAIDILTDLAHTSPPGCERRQAIGLLDPPPFGRISVLTGPPVTAGNLGIQLLYVDIGANTIKLTFSVQAGDQPGAIVYAPLAGC